MSERLLDEVIETTREGKPRENGVTMGSDHLGSIDSGLLEQTADYVDFVKIGLSAPLMVERSRLLERVHRYHDLGIKVLSGGTLLEVAVQKGVVSQVLEGLRSLEFDMVEVSEFAGEIPIDTKQKIVSNISALSMEYVFEVGRRDKPGAPNQMNSRIQEAFELKSRKVVVEVPKGGGSAGKYDVGGEIAWDEMNQIAGTFGPPKLIFETQQMRHLTSLILEFGPAVNLAGVPLDETLILEMQRLGLTTETLGLSRPVQSVGGSPAAKFIYHLIRTEHPIDQATLSLRSGLPRRTVQAALSGLIEGGLIREVSDVSDLRKHKYTIR